MSRDLILIAVALMTWGIGEGMFLYFQPLYLQDLGASIVSIGNILSIIGIAMAVAHLPAGYLADRIGRRPMLFAAWFLGTTAAWIMALSNSLPFFVAGSALYGMTSFVMVPLNSYITAARGNWSVGRVITLVTAIYNIGAILGPLLGGLIGDRLGLRSNFLVAAFFFVLSSSMIVFIRPQPVVPHQNGRAFSAISALLNRRYMGYLLVVFVVMFSLYLPQPLSQNFLQNERGVNLAWMGVMIAGRSLGIVGLNLGLGFLNASSGFILAQLAVAAFTVLIWQGSSLPWYFLGYMMMGGYQTARSLATAQSRALLSDANMGLGYGMTETTMAGAAILAPSLAGRIYDQNPSSIYTTGLALIIIGLLITILRARKLVKARSSVV
jgi:MFS family permease